MTNKYTYKSLKRANQRIRCVIIYPGTWNQQIRCGLQSVSLHRNPRYEALSYAWGNAAKKRSILVDGRTFWVTNNLYLALQRLRLETSSRVMWIDAICINQANDDEKSVQVAMMGTIFANCQKAIMWLGEDPKVPDMMPLSSPPPSLRAQHAFAVCRVLGQGKHIDQQPCFSERFSDSQLLENWTDGLQLLLDMPWWNRIWVVQEMALSREVEFAFASETCSYTMFQDFYHSLHKHSTQCCALWWNKTGAGTAGSLKRKIKKIFNRLDPLVRIRRSMRKKEKISLSELRKRLWYFKATDSRDLIYGLLGMVTDWGNVTPLVPNYKLPVRTVICEALVKSIQQSGSLEILQGNSWSFSKNMKIWDTEGPPTWMKDLIGFKPQAPKAPLTSIFSASKVACPRVSLIDGSMLRIRSLKVDTIKNVVYPVPADDFKMRRRSAVRESMMMLGICDWPQYPPAENMIEAQFWRAVIYDAIELNSFNRDLRRATYNDYYSVARALSNIYHKWPSVGDRDF
ncbi:HET-domain-containing protein [Annulohypoxylon moriforme]|nr:HET-domain-containing protein [Annulohypoxylon moriforme]